MAEGNHPDLKQMAARIIDLVEPELAADGFDLLDIRVFRGGGRLQLRIFVDLQEGAISLDQVASASRTVGMLLEEADPFPGQYVIEVSSPGIRRPLRTLEHYQAVVGQKVDLKVLGHGSRRVRGILLAAEGNQLVVQVTKPGSDESEPEDVEEVKVVLGKVQEGNLDPEFDVQALINADRRKRKEARRAERKAKSKKKGARKSRPRSPKKQEDDSSNGQNE